MNLYLEPQGSNRIIHTLLQQKPKAIWVFFKTSSSSIATEICPSSSSAQIYIGERCLTMSRPWLLVCLFLLIVFTSQFEWKQYGNDDPSPSTSKKHKYISEREETAKEKIILSQEKSIQKLNELVRSLREQLLQCRGENEIVNGISAPLTELLSELERHPLLEDWSLIIRVKHQYVCICSCSRGCHLGDPNGKCSYVCEVGAGLFLAALVSSVHKEADFPFVVAEDARNRDPQPP